MSATENVTVSDAAVGIVELQQTALEIDNVIFQKMIELQKIQLEIMGLRTQRDALLTAAHLCSEFQQEQLVYTRPTVTH